MTTLKELKELLYESAFSTKQKRERNMVRSTTKSTKKHTFLKKIRSNPILRKSNRFHVIVDGVDMGEHVVGSPHTHSQAHTHFSKKFQGHSVQVKIIH